MLCADTVLGTPHALCHPVRTVRSQRGHRRWNCVVEMLRFLGNLDQDTDPFQIPSYPICPIFFVVCLSLSPKTEPAMEVWITESPREFPSSLPSFHNKWEDFQMCVFLSIKNLALYSWINPRFCSNECITCDILSSFFSPIFPLPFHFIIHFFYESLKLNLYSSVCPKVPIKY